MNKIHPVEFVLLAMLVLLVGVFVHQSIIASNEAAIANGIEQSRVEILNNDMTPARGEHDCFVLVPGPNGEPVTHRAQCPY